MKEIYIGNYKLDNEQKEIVFDESKYLLVTAGAGSGKTLTILGKIKYLIEEKHLKYEDILCISFTNDATKSLKEKIIKYIDSNVNIDVYTFHKLSLEILSTNNIEFSISSSDYLEYIIDEFFDNIIFNYKNIVIYVLKYFKKSIKINYLKQYKDFYKNNYEDILSLKKLISKFIHLFKSNGYTLDKFIELDKKIFFPHKKYFIRIVLNIYMYYSNELDSSKKIDFDDMLIKARKIIEDNGYIKKYKYIIIDEYQDTSHIRYLLIKSIINKTNSKLLAVGDDFQSIYRFTGCDLNIFINFNNYFEQSKILKIQNTYRNSNELINIAGKFIMKNKYQIKKNLFSNKNIINPIKIIYINNNKDLIKLINKINTKIMILGRNNNDIYKYIDKDFLSNRKDLKYYTIHCSKGLEEENIIILNLINDINGFPSKIKDNNLIKMVLHSKDNYKYEEERRLFYVALTRTKNNVYLITKKNKESIFIKELLKDNKKNIEIINI